MRLKRTTQTSLFEPDPVGHPLGAELESISNWLDAHPGLLGAVAADLGAPTARGRSGLSCETVLPRDSDEAGRGCAAKLCRRLLRIAVDTLGGLDAARPVVMASGASWSTRWLECADHYAGLLKAVAVQTARRVPLQENVPAAEKIVSLFEPHTDIIRKGGRETLCGHKINLATGRSGLVLDVVVESGNPADSARCPPMLERHREHCGKPPTHAAFDGGYASADNLKHAKEMGVAHAVFSKKRGLKEEDMTSSPWIFDRLRRFRAGVEAGISWLKRCFGLGRCRWRGLARFRAWVQSAVFAHNLVRIARLRPG